VVSKRKRTRHGNVVGGRGKRRLCEVVVGEAGLSAVLALGDEELADVAALAVDVHEAPDLDGLPAVLVRGDCVLDEVTLGDPALLEEVVGDVLLLDEDGGGLGVAKDPVGALLGDAVESALLVGRLETGSGLVGLDLGDTAGRGLLEVDLDGGSADGLADDEADALDAETLVNGVGELLVQRPGASEVLDVDGSGSSHCEGCLGCLVEKVGKGRRVGCESGGCGC
jgi:hypothetical protein